MYEQIIDLYYYDSVDFQYVEENDELILAIIEYV